MTKTNKSQYQESNAKPFIELYERWVELENTLAFEAVNAADTESGMMEQEAKANSQIEEQGQIMRYLCEISSQTPEQVLMKLAIWRRDNADINLQEGFANRGDYIAYSAYCDLMTLTNNWSMATASDRNYFLSL